MNNENKFDDQIKALEKKFKKELNSQFYMLIFLILLMLTLVIIVESSLSKQLKFMRTPPNVLADLPAIRKA